MLTNSSFNSFCLKIVLIALLLDSCNTCHNNNKPSTTNNKIEIEEKPVKNKGIPNIGNSCYMNSVLQILASFYRKPFEKKKNAPLGKAANDIINAITSHEDIAPEEIGQRAKQFFNALKTTSTKEGNTLWKATSGTQQDAHELLVKIFDWLEMPNAETKYKLINPITHAERWKANPDPWSIWHIEIPKHNPKLKTMQDFFNNSLAPGTLEVNWTGYDANNVEATEIPLLNNLDNLYGKMLVITLKRFKHEEEKKPSKITKGIDHPFKLVIKKEQTVDSSQDLHYELAGFIEHSGNTGCGHYLAYTKVGEQWIKYSDDEPVLEVTEQVAEQAAEQAYLFFYKPTKPRRME